MHDASSKQQTKQKYKLNHQQTGWPPHSVFPLQSMGSRRVRHGWVTSLSLFTFMHWRKKWQPTPVFLPGESQGWRSLVGCCLWGHAESDTTEQLNWMNWILVQWFVQALYALRFVLSFCLFGFPLMVKAECGGNPVCWWLGLCFCFVCCLDEASCTSFY